MREQIAESIHPKRSAKEICLTHKGKDVNEDLKTLKDLGILPDTKAVFMITLRTQFELDEQLKLEDHIDEGQMASAVI